MERLKKILVFLMFSCKKATELINKNELIGLSLSEKIILLHHNTICRTCNHYQKKSAIIENIITKSFNEIPDNQLSELKKTEIIKILSKI